MSERYSRIFTYKENTYCEGSPVIIMAGALLLDNTNNKVIAQLKFQSVSQKKIKEMTVEITQLDTAVRVLGEKIKYKYLDLNISTGEIFGSKSAIPMHDNSTRAFTVVVDEVVFEDNSIWKANGFQWDVLPCVYKKIIDEELLKQFKIKYGIEYKNHLLKQKDLWFCICGAINKGSKCYKCGSALSQLEEFDIENLNKECVERLEKEKREKEKLEREIEINIEKKKTKTKKIKKIIKIVISVISILLVFYIIFNTVIVPQKNKNNFISTYGQELYDKIGLVVEGEYISFGTYEQDGDTSNGKEDIEWLVLEVKDSKALVISKYTLAVREYCTDLKGYGNVYGTWETSYVRTWLNNDFLNSAFSEEEKALIPTVVVSADKNPDYNTDPGNATEDKIFLLSCAEADRYFASDRARRCDMTPVATAAYLYLYQVLPSANGKSDWLLRTPGGEQRYVAEISGEGSCYTWGVPTANKGLIRPALWINLSE